MLHRTEHSTTCTHARTHTHTHGHTQTHTHTHTHALKEQKTILSAMQHGVSPVAKLARGTGTYWCWGGEGIWRVGNRLGAVLAAEPLLSGEGGAGT